MTNSLRNNTRKTYNSAQKLYLTFCHQYKQVPLPATEDVLLLYVAYWYKQQLSYSTVHVYLAAIRSLHIFQGFKNHVEGSLRLKQAIKAVHIEHGHSIQKLPITFQILQNMLKRWSYPLGSNDFGVFWVSTGIRIHGTRFL